MVQKRSVQLDCICKRLKIVETNDETCVGHLRAGHDVDDDLTSDSNTYYKTNFLSTDAW